MSKLKLIPNVDTRDADEPEGTVIDQEPAAGSGVLRGDTVTIVVSTGAGSVLVPDVVGQTEDAAKARPVQPLAGSRRGRAGHHRTPTRTAACSSRRRGAGSRVRAGDTVTIVVGVFQKPESSTTSTTTTDDTTTTTTTTIP